MATASTKRQRRPKGSAWYWKQTDSWYYTPPGSKQRVPLKDDNGRNIRGDQNRQAAELALARAKAAGQWTPVTEPEDNRKWLVAQVCSTFIEHCEKAAANGRMTTEYRDEAKRYLNHLCRYCGALPASQVLKGHIHHWVESQKTWRSPVTRRNAITIVLAAFNHAQRQYDVAHRLKGLKKPPQRPRLHSFSPEEEQAIYGATDKAFGNFLFAAIHTGLRPFCELARLTADDVIETDRGMMWKVFSSKTKKTRKIPIHGGVAALTRELISALPVGSRLPVFLNAQGNPWKKVTGVHRFLAIKRKLGWDRDETCKHYSTYTCRHTFAHRMLAGYWNSGRGCSIEVLAELMGDTPKVAFDHYGKEWGRRYQDPLWAAVGLGNAAGN